MHITTIKTGNTNVAVIRSEETVIYNIQSALNLIATINYETVSDLIVLNKTAIVEDFFDLKTKLAEEILQKFINYRVKVAIVGDFSIYSSKSLIDFIYESNNGKDLFFLRNEQEAIDKLAYLAIL
ncbi:DUF4180 domain-containing protein [Serpentinicella alkaliphila]|uniref:Uncharacterized protein DUF4180 n=1 Tax=Serpentinicella alkaliphila TaxID=1734049 RepID=A0A4R2TZU3_9FIRM|nr:DUF4180 domain-containing protein [Serpentinicella alkaliphila]QUH25235.1 DUF4180 domain-containing protein [Serpentinicella alkaliphila]TCQ07045.1 uncharacterized protein DUF4180 [Serpentinicella alkaliphila]